MTWPSTDIDTGGEAPTVELTFWGWTSRGEINIRGTGRKVEMYSS
jgi:hypothetical protein